MYPSQTACQSCRGDKLETEPFPSFHLKSWIFLNTQKYQRGLFFFFYHVVSNPFLLSNEAPNLSQVQLFSTTGGSLFSLLFLMNQRFLFSKLHHLSVVLEDSLTFQICDYVIKLPTSQVFWMNCSCRTQPSLTYSHNSKIDPILFFTHSHSPKGRKKKYLQQYECYRNNLNGFLK